ncbi:hypothetical protein BB559_001709 [Furculomyces boomerangus]|uniref:Major facilitator superfamily (MFS) profile domain-containing protein n=1 Tax=Furculomyces boomerangus TaxID=61424 RepID=A0A2T9YCW1_9FUNG|nr:hypothetical protein BB559_004742 [Furculomyces boomerangus]PVU98291.1 hypothetical protein BB559_001709 [Furculomyces boomerangus]
MINQNKNHINNGQGSLDNDSIENASTISEKSINHEAKSLDTEAPPDTGYAWIILITTTLNYMLVSGGFNSFGAFQEYFLHNMFATKSAQQISWISTATYSFTMFCGLLAGPGIRHFGIRNTCLAACLLSSTGLLLASFSTQIWQLVLTHGVMYGLGSAIMVNCAMVFPSLWFVKHRGIAISIVSSGGGFGSLILVPVIENSIKHLGVGWAYRIFCVMNLVVTGVTCLFFKPRVEFKPLKNIINASLIKDKYTLLVCLCGFFVEIGYIIPLTYLGASVISLGGTSTTSSTLIMLLMGSTGTGKILFGKISDKIGPMNATIIGNSIAACLIITIWMFGKTITTYYVLAVLLGNVLSTFFPLCSVMFAEYYDINKVPQANGLVYLSFGIAVLSGNPLVGLIFDKLGHRTSYKPMIVTSAISYTISVIIMIILKVMTKRKAKAQAR